MASKENIDFSKALVNKEFQFAPFRPTTANLLQSANLRSGEDLLIMDRKGERYAFLLRQMAYHHLAQGKLDREPYLVSF